MDLGGFTEEELGSEDINDVRERITLLQRRRRGREGREGNGRVQAVEAIAPDPSVQEELDRLEQMRNVLERRLRAAGQSSLEQSRGRRGTTSRTRR